MLNVHAAAKPAGLCHRRGSALTFILVVVAATSVAVITLVSFAGQSYRRQISSEYKMATQYAFEGAVSQLRSEDAQGLLSPPLSKNITVGGITTQVTVSDNGSLEANTYRVDATTSGHGQSYARSYVIGTTANSDNLYNYALAFRGAETFNQRVKTYNSGSIYIGGNLTVSTWGCSDAGDLKTTGSVGGYYSMPVSGTTNSNASALSTPSFTAGNYLAAANLYYSYGTSFSGGTAPNGYLIYINGNVTFNSGTYGGKVTVFVTGDVTVNGTMTYADSASQLVVICQGNLKCGASTPTAVGTYYVAGQMSVTDTFTVTRGSVTANSLYMTAALNCTFDPYFVNNPSQLATFKVPGYWP